GSWYDSALPASQDRSAALEHPRQRRMTPGDASRSRLHPLLSGLAVAAASLFLPFLSDVFVLRLRSRGKVGSMARRGHGLAADSALSSFRRFRIRPGVRKGGSRFRVPSVREFSASLYLKPGP